MVVVDNERRYLAANVGARLLFRLTLDEFRSRQIEDLTPPHMLPILHRRWSQLMAHGAVADRYDVGFPDGSALQIVYCALANALPGQHLIVFAPAAWPEDELAEAEEDVITPGHRGPLSPREREVVSLIAMGASLEQLADELTISVSTVRTHLRNAVQKLGARNRAHAIALAMQHGLIDIRRPDPPT